MKKLLTIALFTGTLFAGQSFKGSLIDEYIVKARSEMPKQRFENEYRLLIRDQNFKEAKGIETGKERATIGGKQSVLAPYDKVIEELYQARKSSGSVLASYIALEIGQHIWLMRNGELNDKYLKELTNDLYKHRYCRGYLQQGIFLWGSENREKAIEVMKEGVKNCKDPYLNSQLKLKSGKYQYLIKKSTGKEKR